MSRSNTLEAFYRPLREDIFKFCQAMNFSPTWQQKQLLEDVQAETHNPALQRIGVRSGQGPGKTTASCICGLWRCLQDVDALTVVTAPSMRQCRDVWLTEARRLMGAADPILQRFIDVTRSRVVIAGRPEWGVWTVTAKDPVNAQGYHQENLTFIIEEASGVDRPFIEQIKGTLSNPKALMIMIGNPNSRDCELFDAFNMFRHMYRLRGWNAEDTARDYPWLVSPGRNQKIAEEYGYDSDVYKIRVKGEFPDVDPNCVMSTEWLENCIGMYAAAVIPRESDGKQARQFGLDFARYGGDENVIYRRSGNAIVDQGIYPKRDPADVVDLSFRMQIEAGWRDDSCWYVPDATGMGQGILHKFYRANKQIHEFHNGGRASKPEFANKVTEGWFHLAGLAKRLKIHIPKDNRLIQQLANRQYYTDNNGKLILESKDDFMKRGYDSPDRADACVMAFYDQVVTTAMVSDRTSSRALGVQTR